MTQGVARNVRLEEVGSEAIEHCEKRLKPVEALGTMLKSFDMFKNCSNGPFEILTLWRN